MYVGEEGNFRVSVFTNDGKFIKSFGSKGQAPGQFNTPCGVAVDECGVVYVTDWGNNCRVQLF